MKKCDMEDCKEIAILCLLKWTYTNGEIIKNWCLKHELEFHYELRK